MPPDPFDQAQDVLRAAQRLNALVRDHQDSISVKTANAIVDTCRQAEGWLLGVRRLLEVE